MLKRVKQKLALWALDLIHTDIKASATGPVMVNSPNNPQWSNEKFEVLAKEAYMQCVVAYRCIEEIARAVSSINWKVYKRLKDGNREEQPTHELNKVLRLANPLQSFKEFINRDAAFLCLNGNSFMEGVTTTTGRGASASMGIPMELYSHRPDRVEIIASEAGAITMYKYRGPTGRTVEWPVDVVTQRSKILHNLLFHPTNDWWGLAPTRVASREIDTSNEMTSWNMRLLQNDARPGMVFTTEEFMTDDQFNRLKKMIYERYEGGRNAGKSLILEGGKWKAEKYQLTPSDMDFIEGQREEARRIALAYGVPPQLLGIPGDNTYSNYEQARLAFWEETVFFFIRLYGGNLTNWIFPEDEVMEIDADLSNVPALEVRRKELWERAEKATFLTVNERRQMVGIDPVPDGDVILVQATMVPLGTDLSDDTGGEDEGVDEDEQED